MIETIGPTGHTGGRRTTLAACATFLPGALAGAIATFGLLGAMGGLAHGASDRIAYLAAAAIALGAAALEARGKAIMPQVRRQLPEHWRRVLPMPLAAGLYGVLLGLGFTTFVLSFGVWALMAVAFAVGDPEAGVLAGLAFGVGRALPIVMLAPLAGSPAGIRVTELMASRPGLYRGARAGDAVALAALALVLAGATGAGASRVEVRHAADPAAWDTDLVFQRADRSGVLKRGGHTTRLPGKDPTVGGPFIAVRDGSRAILMRRLSMETVREIRLPHVNALAVSADWLVWRAKGGSDAAIFARRISNPSNLGAQVTVARADGNRRVSAPSVYNGQVTWAVASEHENVIVRRQLPGGSLHRVAASKSAALMTPSIHEGEVLYVKLGEDHQQLRIKHLGGRDHAIHTRGYDNGMLYSTALRGVRAYAGVGKNRIISVAR
jgi:hypothetical protein